MLFTFEKYLILLSFSLHCLLELKTNCKTMSHAACSLFLITLYCNLVIHLTRLLLN